MDIGENFIHPTAIMGPMVKLGQSVFVGPYAIISGYTTIGDNTQISAHAVIGTAAEKRGFFNDIGAVRIGNNCIIREGVTVNCGTFRATEIGDGVIMLRHSHAGHDVIVEDGAVISCNVLLGGESLIMKGANLGLGVAVHQRSVVGSFSMTGMNSTITKTSRIEPYGKYVGSPARNIGSNIRGKPRPMLQDELDEFKRFDELLAKAKA